MHLVGHSYGAQVCLAVAIRNAPALTSLTIIELTAFPLLRQTGDLELYEEVATLRAACVRAFEAGDKQAARRVIDFFGVKGTFNALPDRMRDYVIATTTNIFDWCCDFGFDAPPSAYAGIAAHTLILCGKSGHRSILRSAEILADTMPRMSLKAIAGASHFMMASHPTEVAALCRGHLDSPAIPLTAATNATSWLIGRVLKNRVLLQTQPAKLAHAGDPAHNRRRTKFLMSRSVCRAVANMRTVGEVAARFGESALASCQRRSKLDSRKE